ncbi:hypothetical protein [Ornithinibacillus halophilus]|uniref:Uncharacterized protein n=1 Tax=Ornithinibacillus halophilus TaxID=930117 RepID=A0A1M5JY57_9BACI|nr:hypothetical protein [Ornithinibacillus halophilus]SHG45496.1 hypothetical protein SAMN05216225_103421 [Ornithinibacillus halophilus]
MEFIFEFVQNNVEIIIIIYGLLLLEINISYLREHKKTMKGLEEISSEDEIYINPASLTMLILSFGFNVFRRWYFYFIAVTYTENTIVLFISVVLFIATLYDTLFNYSIEKVRKSKIGLYAAIIDTIYIACFIIYLIIQF